MADNRAEYWRAFEDYLHASGDTNIVLHDLGHIYFRAIRIDGVPKETGKRWILPHFAVVATKQKRRMKAGKRVELVIRRPYYGQLAVHEQSIGEQIPHMLPSDPPTDENETGHFEVWTPHNLDDRRVWQEDFAWFVEHLRLFQGVLEPRVRAMFQ